MFSVVIPCFNRLARLARTLAGFCTQGASESFEVILVDNNGFEEDIDSLFRRYVDAFPLALLRQPRLVHPRATARARNQGLALARHEWIVNIDSDCIPAPDYLSRIRAAIEARSHDNLLIVGLRRFVCGDALRAEDIRQGGCDLASLPLVASPSNYGGTRDRRYPEIETVAQSPHPWAFMHSGNLIHRRDAALAAGGFDEGFDGAWGYEDIEFAHRLITVGGARPLYLAGIECYHQDSGLDGAAAEADGDDRLNKIDNPNWARICERIPGFEAFKRDQYRRINPMIRT